MNTDKLIEIQNAYLRSLVEEGQTGLLQAPTLEQIEFILNYVEGEKE